MRQFLILMLLSACLSSPGQNSSIEFYENFFRHHSKTIQFIYGDDSIPSERFDSTIAVMYSRLYWRPYPNQYSHIYGHYYGSNKTVMWLADFIDCLPFTKDAYYANIKTIEEKLNDSKPFVRILISTHLLHHFMTTKDSMFLMELANKSDSLAKGGVIENYRAFAPLMLALGDRKTSVGEIADALELYTIAISTLADSSNAYSLMADIESKIAELYMYRPGIAGYRSKSIEHRDKAARYYSLSGDQRWSNNEKIKAAILYMSDNIRIGFKEIFAFSQEYNTSGLYNVVNYDSVSAHIYNKRREQILVTAYNAFNTTYSPYPQDYNFNLFSLIGDYFQWIGDYQTAKTYFGLAFLLAIREQDYSLSKAILGLTNLALVNAYSGGFNKATAYIDRALELSNRTWQRYHYDDMPLVKARILLMQNKVQEALLVAKERQEFEKGSFSFNKSERMRRGDQMFSEIYDKLEKKDSALFYKEAFFRTLSADAALFEDLVNIETSHSSEMGAKEIENLNRQITEKGFKLARANLDLATSIKASSHLKGTIAKMYFKERGLQKQIFGYKDSLSRLDSLLTQRASEIRQKEAYSKLLQVEIADNEKRLRKTKDRVWTLTAIAIFILGIAVYYRVRSIAKDKRILRTRAFLSDLARSKVHDIRGVLNSLYLRLLKGDLATALLYTEKSASALQLSLDKWDLTNTTYTLSDEINISDAIFEAAKVLTDKDISFSYEFSEELKRKQNKILLMPETLTTCLNNSLQHAFKERTKDCQIRIRATEMGKVLIFEVSDNGKGLALQPFINPQKPHKGLSILKRRLEDVFNEKKVPKKLRLFEIYTNAGTTIKFSFPYELSS